MSSTSETNKRIAKNTIFLYFRTLFTMAVSLYTSRLILATLGVDDFGTYNVVGGIVMFLSFLNTSMASATQRFLNVELGKGDKAGVKRVFTNAVIIHFSIAACVVILAETVGVWFLNTHVVIADNRLWAANYVLQFSIATMLVSIISVPYNAVIIANERMSVFAYISILEVSLKLLLVLLLVYLPFDKLVTFAALTFSVSVIVRLIYGVYCKKHFDECRDIKYHPDKSMVKKMMGFSSWTVVGALSSIGHSQGISIVMNLFFGMVVNAAYGIANQINQVVNNFVGNFMTALNPQIVKTYSANELPAMHTLMSRGCRIGFFLVLFFVVPIFIEARMLLSVWLKDVPDYTVGFVRIILLITLFNSFASPLSVAQGATGNIRNYQIVLTLLGLSHIPLAWLCFKQGWGPNYGLYVYLLIVFVEQAYRIFKVSHSVSMPLKPFVKSFLLRCLYVLCVSFALPMLMHVSLPVSFLSSLITGMTGAVCVAISALYIGLDEKERTGVFGMVKSKVGKLN